MSIDYSYMYGFFIGNDCKNSLNRHLIDITSLAYS